MMGHRMERSSSRKTHRRSSTVVHPRHTRGAGRELMLFYFRSASLNCLSNVYVVKSTRPILRPPFALVIGSSPTPSMLFLCQASVEASLNEAKSVVEFDFGEDFFVGGDTYFRFNCPSSRRSFHIRDDQLGPRGYCDFSGSSVVPPAYQSPWTWSIHPLAG